jgi:tripartite-type tricarboxylate transporter receptor subunit TctC
MSVNPVVQANLAYDPLRDLAPVGMAMQVPHCLVVQPNSPHRSVADVVRASQAAPDSLGVGTAGVASATHLSLEAFKTASGARLLHVPYRGGGASLPDFLAGNIPMLFIEFSTILAAHRDGRARIIAVASASRLAAASDVPTMDEQGVRGFLAGSYVGLVATAGSPAEAMRRLGAAMTEIVALPAFRERMAALGGEAATATLASPDGFRAFIAEDIARSRAAARAANITPQ